MRIRQAVSGLLFTVICVVLCAWIFPAAHSQSGQPAPASKNLASSLLQKMVGTWNVQQRMWPGYGEAAVKLPPAIARRRMVEDIYLEEVMELETGSSEKPFNRTAYFNFNAVNHQYEYFSLDTRAPQMMSEKSHRVRTQGESSYKGGIVLYGGRFVAPKWGKATNVAFTYRLKVGDIEKESQIVRLYFTPQTGRNTKEFLAFEYLYTRQR